MTTSANTARTGANAELGGSRYAHHIGAPCGLRRGRQSLLEDDEGVAAGAAAGAAAGVDGLLDSVDDEVVDAVEEDDGVVLLDPPRLSVL